MSATKNESLDIKAVFQFSSQGQRSCQEDYLLVDRDRRVFAVADGFGGPLAGVAAAKTACEAIRGFLYKEAGDLEATLPFVLRKYFSLAGNVLFNSVIHANRKLLELNHGKNIHEKGGASALAAFVDGELLALANVGVCRALLFRGAETADLVAPRSYGNILSPFKGTETEEDHRAPLIALGMTDDLAPEIAEYRLQKGDWLTFLTDGVPITVQDEICKIKQKKLSLEAAGNLFLGVLEKCRFVDNAAVSLVIF